MITRGIIEEILSPYKVKIRVPLLDGISSEGLSTNTNNLKKETTEDFLKALDELNGEDR